MAISPFLYIVVAVVVLILAGVAVTVVLFFRRQRQEMIDAYERGRDAHAAQERAIWAGATVVDVRTHKVGLYGSDRVRVDLRLQVQPPGGEPYIVNTSWSVDPVVLSQLQSGAGLSVKIDADDPGKIYPNMSGVEYWLGG